MRLIEYNLYFIQYLRRKKLNIHQAFFEGFVLALILSYLPNARLFSYLGPFFVCLWLLLRTQSGKLLMKLALTIGAYLLYVIFCGFYYTLQGFEYHYFNSILVLLTYSPFFVVFNINTGSEFSNELTDLKRYEKLIGFMLLIQGLVGIFQFSILRFQFLSTEVIPEDAVQGTMGLLRFMGHPVDAGFGNQMYVILTFMLLLFYIPLALNSKKGFFNIFISLFSLILASVLHVFISFALALFTASLLFFLPVIGRRFKELILFSSLIFLGFFIAKSIYPNITGTANVFFEFLVKKGDSPKNLAVKDAVFEMPKHIHEVWIFGLGPGQFSSRAGLIGTGEYFQADLPFIANKPTHAYENFGYKHWIYYRNNNGIYGDSTMHRPFFSMLSLFAELGTFGILLIAIILTNYLLKKIKQFYRFLLQKRILYANMALVNGIMVLFIFYISFFENYLEASQAIFPGLLLLRYYDSILKNKKS